MQTQPENQPETIEYYKNRCEELERENEQLKRKMNWITEQAKLKQHQQFGSSSEKIDEAQMQLFNEAEAEQDPLTPEPKYEVVTYTREKKKGNNRKINTDNLPVEEVEYRLPEEEQVCSCGHTLHEMSKETREELKIIPAQAKLVKHQSYVYSCRNCEQNDITTPVKTAKKPEPVIKKSLASPSIVAHTMIQKYQNGMPLYRQEQEYNHLGINLSRQNLANWVVKSAENWLSPVYERLHSHLLDREVLQADETGVQVLKEPGRKAESTSYMWLYRTGGCYDHPIVLFDYQETRASKHPQRFLDGFKGYLHVDGYAGYEGIPNVTLVGCWSHARRGFHYALQALPPPERDKEVASNEGLEYCNQLFAIERELKDKTPEERHRERQARSRPVLDAFLAWLKTQNEKALPKSYFGKAVHYCLKQWYKLEAFMQDGRLEIDNNRSERSIKPFITGRKNWLFSNTPAGAKASAVIYSIIETAKENGLNPFYYLMYLFETLPQVGIEDKETVDKLLPWSEELPESCKVTKSEG